MKQPWSQPSLYCLPLSMVDKVGTLPLLLWMLFINLWVPWLFWVCTFGTIKPVFCKYNQSLPGQCFRKLSMSANL